MHPTTPLTLLLAAITTTMIPQAQAQSTISVFLPNTDPQPLVGSLIHSDNTATTLAIQCPPNTPAESCGYPIAVTVTAGPSTFHATYPADTLTSIIVDCTGQFFTSPQVVTCAETYVGPGDILLPSGTRVVSGTNTAITSATVSVTLRSAEVMLFPVTITAGANAGGSVVASASQTTLTGTNAASASAGSGSGSSASVSRTGGAATASSSNSASRADGMGANVLNGLAAIMAIGLL